MNPVSVLPVPSSPLTAVELASLSDDQIEDGLRTWAGRVAAGDPGLLAYIGEFDERRAWAVDGVLSCAHWLSWRLGMGPNAAGERVRVARALRALPATFTAFAAGRLSYAQVLAISRAAGDIAEQTLIDLARHATGGQLERLVSGLRRARKLLDRRDAADGADDGVAPALERIRVHTRYDDDGDLQITIRASATDGTLLLAAIEAARTDLDATPTRIFPRKDPPAPTAPSRRPAATGCSNCAGPTSPNALPPIPTGPAATVPNSPSTSSRSPAGPACPTANSYHPAASPRRCPPAPCYARSGPPTSPPTTPDAPNATRASRYVTCSAPSTVNAAATPPAPAAANSTPTMSSNGATAAAPTCPT